jgi:putative MATE family efflux protein
MQEKNNLSAFNTMPPFKAIIKSALPAIMAMLMVLVYNLADTFFIGQTHDDFQVAAVSLSTPVFMILMALGQIFGIGGASVIARALGNGRGDYVKKVSSFCVWLSIAAGVMVSVFLLVFMDDLLRILGAKSDTWELTKNYLVIFILGGALVVVSNCFSSILRAEGQPTKAMAGMLIGNIINVVLDPIMILLFGWGVKGAALATVIGNIIATVYYLFWFLRGKSILSMRPRDFSVREKIPSQVLLIGIPAALNTMLLGFSQIIMNGLLSAYGSLPVAAAGVAFKVTMIISVIAVGLGQGIQPLLGFAVGAGTLKRYKEIMRTSVLLSVVLCSVLTGFCYIFTRNIVSVFLSEPEALNYGVKFAQILQSTAFLFGIFYCFNNAIQAMGAAMASFVVNISRQGLIYIPALFVLQGILGMHGLIWAQPIADVLSLALAIVLHTVIFRRMSAKTT